MKTLTAIIILTLISFSMHGQDLAGQWDGTLNVQGAQLRIVFHVNKNVQQFQTTMDSPDQGATGIPVTATSFNNPNVKFEIAALGMLYEGTISGDNISGEWKQSGRVFPLVLIRKSDHPEEKNN
jgi:hypothetical protein